MIATGDVAALRDAVRGWRRRGETVALVPTMGNLHAGHYSLLDMARAHAQRVVASVFVNPTQFGPGEDFERYPRTLDADRAGLEAQGCDLLFAPEVVTMYPFGLEAATSVHVPALTDTLEGAHRPGHFDGVTSVVARLFNLVAPDLAVFGRKDYQQWRVIERMTRDLGLPITILGAPIRRDPDGLALSSRNQYLDADQRRRAPALQQTLVWLRERLRAGEPWRELEQAAAARLRDAGFAPDYVAIRRGSDLREPESGETHGLVALAAAKLGSTRLIDNLDLD